MTPSHTVHFWQNQFCVVPLVLTNCVAEQARTWILMVCKRVACAVPDSVRVERDAATLLAAVDAVARWVLTVGNVVLVLTATRSCTADSSAFRSLPLHVHD